MTEMPIEHAAHAALAPPHPSGVAARLREVIPDLHRLATRPALLDAVARAVKAGVPDAEVQGLIAGLHGLAHKHEGLARQNGSGPQPGVHGIPDIPALRGERTSHPEDPDGM